MTLTATPSAHKKAFTEETTRQRFVVSSFLTALAIVALLDLFLSFKHPLEMVSTVNLDRSEYYLGFRSYLLEAKRDSAPKVVLLGSSILMQPLMEKESTFLDQPIKPFQHRRLHSIEALIADHDHQSSNFPSGSHVYCLAMGGEMISDGYLMLKKSIEAKQIPQVVIIEVAPRDFQCNVVPDITNSDAFKLWAGGSDLPEILQSSDASFEQKGDFVIGCFSTLFRYRADYGKFLLFKIKTFLDKLPPWPLFEKIDGQGNKGLFKKGVLVEDTPGSITALPGVAMAHRNRDEMISEYARNYLPVSQKQVNLELNYLAKTLDLCQRYSISPCVVDMPLSQTNRDILPDGFYDNYRKRLHEVVEARGLRLIELQDATWDADSSYMDTVHVNPANVDRLVNAIFRR